ncbi:hypothetical protein P7C73_g4893, partial [Tremellales sp. Uapishka_1]
MSHTLSTISPAGREVDEDAKRAQRLASAKKKLKTFRASRSSAQSQFHSHSTIPSTSSTNVSPRTSSTSLPLSTSAGLNMASLSRHTSRGSIKDKDVDADKPKNGHAHSNSHSRSRSRASGSHKRGKSSIARPGVGGLFDIVEPIRGESSALKIPQEIITTPATPLMESPTISSFPPGAQSFPDENATLARLSSFSFGAKPSTSAPAALNRRQPLLPSLALLASDQRATSPPSSSSAPNVHRLSTPSSRPPSLLVTRPTPLAFGSPSGPSRHSLGAQTSPSTPPTPGRRRHSHNRSTSISLPNTAFARPLSLGIPNSPSYPSSPSSPASGADINRSSIGASGTRLKFEPSGRGAEAEKERAESRQKALEKLTGGPPRPFEEERGAEIALPDFDDDDTSSIASSVRPISGIFGSSYNRPTSITLPGGSSSPFAWSTSEPFSPVETSPSFPYFKEEAMGFGLERPSSGGAGVSSASVAGGLCVLAEEEEDVEEEASVQVEEPSLTAPTPSRLKELHLLSSSMSPADTLRSLALARAAASSPTPPKAYGAIGRGRPRPLSGLGFTGAHSSVFTSATSSPGTGIATPKSAASRNKGSRGSSISYKRDGSSSSSRDWDMTSKLGSPPLPSSLASPPPPSLAYNSPGGWANVPRGNGRPCPRPKNLVGLGLSGRILGEVGEEEEERGSGWKSASASSDGPFRFGSRDEAGSEVERERAGWEVAESMDEVVLERDALREDVDLWRKRCRGLEERLEAERKESGVLRERVRKRESRRVPRSGHEADTSLVGDRLSEVSTSHPDPKRTDQSQLISEMRDQLFALTTSLDKAQKDKNEAETRLAVLEMESLSTVPPLRIEDPPMMPPLRPIMGRCLSSVREAEVEVEAEAEAEAEDEHEVPSPPAQTEVDSFSKLKSWGFPRGPAIPSATRRHSKKDSFFGLNSIMAQTNMRLSESPASPVQGDGVDLPPFIVSDAFAFKPSGGPEHSTGYAGMVPEQPLRSISNPLSSSSTIPSLSATSMSARSASLTTAASTLSFLSGYLPIAKESASSSELLCVRNEARLTRTPSLTPIGRLDFRAGCKRCVGHGEIIEL